ncbi:MAG: GHKL domain-containing protein, partial [Oscillospiraceae bacterium]
LEAAQQVPAQQQRQITVDMRFAAGVLEIACANPYVGVIRRRGGRFISQKQDGAPHGYGTRIIRQIAEKLGGGANFTWENGVFRVVCRLNLGLPA